MITISLVSHGHDAWLPGLLQQLADTGAGTIAHVVVTHNLPGARQVEAEKRWPFRLTQLNNGTPAGFGANHNRAFERADTELFCVLNPDVSLPEAGVWKMLAAEASRPGVGCAFPTLLNADGTVQDNARAVVTPWALFRRRILKRRDHGVDWVSAAFWVVPSAAYRQLGGFDERYYMYCEDVDFCLRLQIAGFRLVQVPVHAVHHAQRGSHHRWRHLGWHVQSLLRLWSGSVLRTYLAHLHSPIGRS